MDHDMLNCQVYNLLTYFASAKLVIILHLYQLFLLYFSVFVIINKLS